MDFKKDTKVVIHDDQLKLGFNLYCICIQIWGIPLEVPVHTMHGNILCTGDDGRMPRSYCPTSTTVT